MFIVNVEAAIYKGDRWLIGRRSEMEEHAAGGIALIGGKVEDEGFSSDILERTVIREIREEVGVEVSNLEYVQSASFVTDDGTAVVNIIFLCKYAAGEAAAKDPNEISEIFWLTAEEVVHHPEAPTYLKEYLQRAEKQRLDREKGVIK